MGCRNKYPRLCKSIYELSKTVKAGQHGVPQGAYLVGAPAKLPPGPLAAITDAGVREFIISKLPATLSVNQEWVADSAWCFATSELLQELDDRGHLKVSVFRKAVLVNNDKMSSSLDKSQPESDNTWGLVPYADGYICVIQALYFVEVSVESQGVPGFSTQLCMDERFGITPPDNSNPDMRFRPFQGVVAKEWLAQGCVQGGVGCRTDFDFELGVPPDLVLVSNIKESNTVLEQFGDKILNNPDEPNRYCGENLIRIDDIFSLVARAAHPSQKNARLFLTSAGKSGK